MDPIIKQFCEEELNELVTFSIKQNIDILQRNLEDVKRKLDTGRGFFNPLGEFQGKATTERLNLDLLRYSQAKQLCDRLE